MVIISDKEIDGNIKIILKSLKALDNKDRREILRLCEEKPKTISELKNILKSSNKVTWNNVDYLEKEGFVKLDKREKEKHRPVFVSSLMTSEEALLSISAQIQSIFNV